MKEETKKRFEAELSPNARLLIALFDRCEVGDIVTYDEMSSTIGIDIKKKRGLIRTACNRMQYDKHRVFAAVRGEGMQRLEDSQIVKVTEGTGKRIFRAAGRGLKKLACTDTSKLDEDQLNAHNVSASILAAHRALGGAHAKKQLAAAVERQNHEIPVASTMKMFST